MKLDKIKLKKSFNDAGDSFVGFGRKLRTGVDGLAEKGKEVWDRKSPEVRKACGDWQSASEQFFKSAGVKVKEGASGIMWRVTYSKERMNSLQNLVKCQGGYYRELCRGRREVDMLALGGESVAKLAIASHIPEAIQSAYEAANPIKAQSDNLADELNRLKGDELTGFLAGIKGKLFEQQYVEYLNDGNLPDGYSAHLAPLVNQSGWDIAIGGPNQELVEVIQAKATDSVGYVVGAMHKNPHIDIVTTDEVYSHLVMSGVSESLISNSGITNASLEEALSGAHDAADIGLNFSPPWFTLGLIAFTTYKSEDLTLFQKARSAGDRTGKAYLSYLLGGTLAAVTNTWWLGVVGTIASRYLADEGNRRRAIFEKLKQVAKRNEEVIGKLENYQPA